MRKDIYLKTKVQNLNNLNKLKHIYFKNVDIPTSEITIKKVHTLAHRQWSHLQGKLHGPCLDRRRHPYSFIKVNEQTYTYLQGISRNFHKNETEELT